MRVRILEDYDGGSNRHMTMAYMVAPRFRDALVGVTSIDGTCRPHIVPDDAEGRFAELLRVMKARTGFGVVLNTSYNIHGEPLVCSPAEAIDVYLRTGGCARHRILPGGANRGRACLRLRQSPIPYHQDGDVVVAAPSTAVSTRVGGLDRSPRVHDRQHRRVVRARCSPSVLRMIVWPAGPFLHLHLERSARAPTTLVSMLRIG